MTKRRGNTAKPWSPSWRSPPAGEPARGAQRHRHQRVGRILAARRDEHAAVGDEDVVHLMHSPVRIDNARRRGHAHLHPPPPQFLVLRGGGPPPPPPPPPPPRA